MNCFVSKLNCLCEVKFHRVLVPWILSYTKLDLGNAAKVLVFRHKLFAFTLRQRISFKLIMSQASIFLVSFTLSLLVFKILDQRSLSKRLLLFLFLNFEGLAESCSLFVLIPVF